MSNLAVIPHFLLHYSLFNKVAGLPVNSVKFLRTSFFIVAASILCRNSFHFYFTVFSECLFSNCLKHLKGFCCECEHTLF